MHRIICHTFALLLGLSLWGCSSAPQPEVFPGSQPIPQPVNISLLLDMSGSGNANALEKPDMRDVQRLVDLVNLCGGDLTIVPITADTRYPIVRLRLPIAQPRPVAPPETGDPFARRAAIRAYESKNAAYERHASERDAHNATEIAAFMAEAELLLTANANARHTDIWGAFRRVNTLITEDYSALGQPARNFAVLITDGDHNVQNSTYLPFESDIEILLVNNTTSLGDLTQLQPAPKQFASLVSALDYLQKTVEG